MTESPKTRVLVAEDSPGLAKVIQFNLQHAGFEVTVAKNGLEARQAAENQQFDVILSDQQMPKMTGTELFASLREMNNYANTPCILLTAKSLELDKTELTRTLRISSIIPKPFSPKELISVVENVTVATA